MKLNSVLYISPKAETISLDIIKSTLPGEIIQVSYSFVRKLTDEQFEKFCGLDNDFRVNEKAARLIHARMERLGVRYSIDHKNNTLKIGNNGN